MPNKYQPIAEDLALVIGVGLNSYLGDYTAIYEETARALNEILNGGILITAKGDYCWICGRRATQLHHIAGEKHDERTIPLCDYCHAMLSSQQSMWGNGWEKKDRPERLRQAFFLMGIRDILNFKSEVLWSQGDTIRAHMYKDLAAYYTVAISKRLKE